MSLEEETAELSTLYHGLLEENAALDAQCQQMAERCDRLEQLVRDCLAHMNNENQSMAVYRQGREALQARAYELLGGPAPRERKEAV